MNDSIKIEFCHKPGNKDVTAKLYINGDLEETLSFLSVTDDFATYVMECDLRFGKIPELVCTNNSEKK